MYSAKINKKKIKNNGKQEHSVKSVVRRIGAAIENKNIVYQCTTLSQF